METQLATELNFNWTDKQELATEAADLHKFTLYGGSRGPGKSYWLRWWLLRFVLLASETGFRGVRVGLFCEDYPSLKDRQISKIHTEFPRWLGELKESKTDGLGFHLHDERGVIALRNLDDVSKYQSSEFAAIGVDELTKNSVETFNVLRGSLRWPGMRNTRFVSASNPGSIGHLWVKSYWLDRQYPPELQTLANEFAFVRALPDDNPHLDATYWNDLETLPADLARAWRWGDWDVFAGQVFGSFSRDRHVCKAFEIPKHWQQFGGLDWGYSNPFAFHRLAKDPDTGRVYVTAELYERELTDRQQARMVKKYLPLRTIYADPSMWTTKNMEDKTFSSADEYRAEGVILTKADNNRLIGKRKIATMLEPSTGSGTEGSGTEQPGLMIFENCPNLIRTLPALPHDQVNVEDVDTDAEDHAYDALRYGLTAVNPRPARKAPPPPKPVDRLLLLDRDYRAKQNALSSKDL